MSDASARQPFQLALSAFAIVHAGLHWLLRRHPLCEFNNALAWGLILGTAAAGTVYLALRL